MDRALERVLSNALGAPSPLPAAMRYSVMSEGKRFRPLLCLGGAAAVGGRRRAAMPAACAIELIHTYSLVHDDLPAMDNADTRRGQPACHRKFGEAHAILVGDALLTLSFELLSRNGMPNALAIVRRLSQAAGTDGLIGGQVLDLGYAAKRAGGVSLEQIARRKTAALITASVVTGGMAGDGRGPQLDALERFGRRLGLAFQVIDDLHDGDGLAASLGPAAAERKARRLIRQAVEGLAPFGARAGILRDLADWLEATISG